MKSNSNRLVSSRKLSNCMPTSITSKYHHHLIDVDRRPSVKMRSKMIFSSTIICFLTLNNCVVALNRLNDKTIAIQPTISTNNNNDNNQANLRELLFIDQLLQSSLASSNNGNLTSSTIQFPSLGLLLSANKQHMFNNNNNNFTANVNDANQMSLLPYKNLGRRDINMASSISPTATSTTTTTTTSSTTTTASPSIIGPNSDQIFRNNNNISGTNISLRNPNQVVIKNSSLSWVRQRWRQMERSIGLKVLSYSQELRQFLDEINNSPSGTFSQESHSCRFALNELVEGLSEQKLWSVQMIDASAHIPSGLLGGTLTELGNFDQCLAINYQGSLKDRTTKALATATTNMAQLEDTERIDKDTGGDGTAGTLVSSVDKITRGQYCSLLIKPHLTLRPRLHTVCQRLPTLSATSNQTSWRWLSQNSHQFHYAGLRLGICVPSKCSRIDIQQLLNAYLSKFELLGHVKYCQVQKTQQVLSNNESFIGLEFSLDIVQKCIVSTFVLLLVLSLLGTLLDYLTKSSSPKSLPLINSNKLATGQDSEHSTSVFNDGGGGATIVHDKDDGQTMAAMQQGLVPVSTITGQKGAQLERLYQQQRRLDRNKKRLLEGNKQQVHGSKRWQYQVHRGGSTECNSNLHHFHHSTPSLDCHSSSGATFLGPQRNPIAEQPLITLKSAFKGDLTLDQLLTCDRVSAIKKNKRSSSSWEATEENLTDEEVWISKLEKNQLEPDEPGAGLMTPPELAPDVLGIGRGGNGGDSSTNSSSNSSTSDEKLTLVSSKSSSRLMLVDLIVCFSLRKNLQIIGKHVGSSHLSSSSSSSSSTQTSSVHNSNSKEKQVETQMGDIKVIHGLRTLTMIWIIFGHTIGLVEPQMMNNLFSLAQLSCSSRFLQALLNATLAVNTFFMINGLVTVISFARKCQSALPLLLIREKPKPTNNNDNNNLLNVKTTTTKTFKPQNHDNHQLHQVTQKKKTIGGSKQKDCDCLSDVSSLDSSSSSIISSLSSSASSNRCIGRTIDGVSKGAKTKLVLANGGIITQQPTNVINIKKNHSHTKLPQDFKPFLWLLMRYLRLTPTYALIIGLSILLPSLGSGPFWQELMGQMGTNCRNNWWTNLLYVNNFIETDKLCLIHSWYLSNDWQFFTLSLLLFGLFYLSKKLTLLLTILLIIGCSAANFALTVSNDFPPTIVTTSPAIAERWLFIHSLYYKPWPHMPSYLVGMIVGYLIIIKDRFTISSSWRTIIWLLCTLVAISLLNSIYPWNMGLQVEPMLTGLHSATFRTIWSICCAWLVFALVTKPQNVLARLLSWHGFQITSRLTYCAYLVHPLIIYYHFGMLRERLDSSIYGQSHRFIATLGLSYLFALLLSLLIEGPSIQIQHFLSNLHPNKRKDNFLPSQKPSSANGHHNHHHHHRHHRNNNKNHHHHHNWGLNNKGGNANRSGTRFMGVVGSEDTPITATTSWSTTSSFSEGQANQQTNHQAAAANEHMTHQMAENTKRSSLSATDNLLPTGAKLYLNPGGRFENCKHELSRTNCFVPNDSIVSQMPSTRLAHLSALDLSAAGGDCDVVPALRTCSSVSHESSAAQDADFQRRLAQAISRGFRIRSRLAANNSVGNPTIATTTSSSRGQGRREQILPIGRSSGCATGGGGVGLGARRATQIKRISVAENDKVTNPNGIRYDENYNNINDVQYQLGGDRPSTQLSMAGNKQHIQMSTFLPSTSNATSRTNLDRQIAATTTSSGNANIGLISGHDVVSASKAQLKLTKPTLEPMDLSEMIRMQQKLFSRSQSQIDNVK